MWCRACVFFWLLYSHLVNFCSWICSVIYSLPGCSAFSDVILVKEHKQEKITKILGSNKSKSFLRSSHACTIKALIKAPLPLATQIFLKGAFFIEISYPTRATFKTTSSLTVVEKFLLGSQWQQQVRNSSSPVHILHLNRPVAAQLMYLRLKRCQLRSNSKSPL